MLGIAITGILKKLYGEPVGQLDRVAKQSWIKPCLMVKKSHNLLYG